MGKLDTRLCISQVDIEYIGLTGLISSSQQELSESHNSLKIPLGL
jgi:hypothetical protein